MELILWRHAEAEDGVDDMQRALTRKGQRQADKMAAFLRPRLPANTRIVVSPALRTQQTARAFCNDFSLSAAIAPDATPEALLHAAGWPDADGCVLLIGHQPTLGMVAGQLLTGSPLALSLKKGGLWWFSHQIRDGHPRTLLRLVNSPDLL